MEDERGDVVGDDERDGAAERAARRARGRRWSTAGALGLVLGGVALLVVATTGGTGPFTEAPTRWSLVALLALAGLAGLAGLRSARRPGADLPGPRACAVVAVVLLGFATALAVFVMVAEVAGGLPDAGATLPVVGTASAALAAVLCALAARSTAPRHWTLGPDPEVAAVEDGSGLVPRGRRVAAAALGGALAAVLGVVVTAVAVAAPVRSVTAASAPAAEEGPLTLPTEVAWAVQPEPGQVLRSEDVVPAGAGIAHRSLEGVVALDGRTGEQRWRYEVSGVRTQGVGASPDGSHVVVLLRSGTDSGSRLVALDGRTGEVLRSTDDPYAVVASSALGGLALRMSGTHLVGLDEDAGALVGWAADGTSQDWTLPLPSACGRMDAVGTASTVVELQRCPGGDGGVDEAVAVAVDQATGREAWRRTWPLPRTGETGEDAYVRGRLSTHGREGESLVVDLDVEATEGEVTAVVDVLDAGDGSSAVPPDALVDAEVLDVSDGVVYGEVPATDDGRAVPGRLVAGRWQGVDVPLCVDGLLLGDGVVTPCVDDVVDDGRLTTVLVQPWTGRGVELAVMPPDDFAMPPLERRETVSMDVEDRVRATPGGVFVVDALHGVVSRLR
ncbi:PQQ-binding-like beta-propeller repeat protein [Pseudokineococcus marinus]|uniref:PQQ-binding-like beta-propeller repeat protein n=1 Tax=Pseudokineococcus marinus TaxID=351215 RepID=A0A849BPS8_9ACTN|nr:PQQ-binding-like beta-propeller repeat protein [Pseudokineococcus marinus]NNH22832.1 PQQ-binding-like beta-propeller repeat protein [Pseudokineococcus marinus]